MNFHHGVLVDAIGLLAVVLFSGDVGKTGRVLCFSTSRSRVTPSPARITSIF
jgi:hypothetical protein